MVTCAGLSDVNSTLRDTQATAATLTTQQFQLNNTLQDIFNISTAAILGCMTAQCNTLRTSLGDLNTGSAYAVSRRHIVEFLLDFACTFYYTYALNLNFTLLFQFTFLSPYRSLLGFVVGLC